MPIAHTCASCGNDLTRIRAPLDPHYALPVVVCPECHTASVRRSDGERAIPRKLRWRYQAARRLTESLALLFIFSAGTVGLCFALQATLETYRIPFFQAVAGVFSGEIDGLAYQWRNDVGIVVFIMWLVMCTATGAYLAAAARHCSRPRLLAAWLAPVALTLALPVAIMVWEQVMNFTRSGQPGPPRWLPREARWAIATFYQVLIGAVIVMAAGVLPGILIRRRLDSFADRRFRRVRKRLITRRQRA